MHAILGDRRSRGSGDTRGDRQTQDEDLLYRSTKYETAQDRV